MYLNKKKSVKGLIRLSNDPLETRHGRPRWNQTLHQLAPPLKKNIIKKWHMTRDTWHLTPETLHVTPDLWHLVGVNILSKFQLPSSFGSCVMIFWMFDEKGWLTDWISDCRTAPATPGLLIMKESLKRAKYYLHLMGFFFNPRYRKDNIRHIIWIFGGKKRILF